MKPIRAKGRCRTHDLARAGIEWFRGVGRVAGLGLVGLAGVGVLGPSPWLHPKGHVGTPLPHGRGSVCLCAHGEISYR